MLRGLVNKTIHENLNSVEFEGLLLRKIEETKTLRMHVKMIQEGMIDNQYFIDLVAPVIKKETKNAVDVKSKIGAGQQKFDKAAYSTDARSAASSGPPPTDISYGQTNKKA